MLVAPNLTQLMGQNIGAKLISKAGSLTNLAKAPASTIQILGAEKALFRALKKRKGNTPKYGLIFHSTFIQRAAKEHKGKISRYLANKAALASRIDCFMDAPPTIFGEKLREQVEARLNFFDTGTKPPSNKAAMSEALQQYQQLLKKREKKKSKRSSTVEEGEIASTPTTTATANVEASEERSARKSKHKIASEDIADELSNKVEGRVSSKKARASEVMQSDATESESPKKKKSKKEKVAVA